jgi:outer membrane receptor protein involved in Fe transport
MPVFSRKLPGILFCAALLCGATVARGTVFATVRGIVHDQQHMPIEGAEVRLEAVESEWSQTASTDADGRFHFDAVPMGEYRIRIKRSGFRDLEQTLELRSSAAPVLHFQMQVAGVYQTIVVSGAAGSVSTESSTTEQLISRQAIENSPGANRTNSLAAIANTVPGAYLVHDQLHIRGGHQVSWLVDGVPVPNTNIASNVGPQFDPKDIDYIEVQRGGFAAEYGDRTYSVFNVIPRSGFERSNEGQLLVSFGSLNQTNDYLSFGSHTSRFAYYAGINGNRTDLGLEPPTADGLHGNSNGVGGFSSLIFNATRTDQLRFTASLRHDFFQVPNSPADQLAGTRDAQTERDAFVNFSWLHTFSPGALLTISPFYHYNRAEFAGGPNDMPFTTVDDRSSHYAGGQASLGVVRGRHNARFGVYAFGQKDSQTFGLVANDGSGTNFSQRVKPSGQLEAIFLGDQFRITNWLTVNGGVRMTHYAGSVSENAADPRVGAALCIPYLGWVFRASYSRTYQAPPLDTLSGSILQFAANQGAVFLPLHGERDEQTELGLAIPFRGWTFDFAQFHNRARNFFDHDVLGNSNIFVPLTIQTARIRAYEITMRSPLLFHRGRVHLAYSRQVAQGRGGVTGGLNGGGSPGPGYFFLDHDQRHTLASGFEAQLPWRSMFSANAAFGSGFLDGNGPQHKPTHTTVDLAISKSIGERITLGLTALNIADRRYLLDDSNTFGGTHFNYPREIIGSIRFRFHY